MTLVAAILAPSTGIAGTCSARAAFRWQRRCGTGHEPDGTRRPPEEPMRFDPALADEGLHAFRPSMSLMSFDENAPLDDDLDLQ